MNDTQHMIDMRRTHDIVSLSVWREAVRTGCAYGRMIGLNADMTSVTTKKPLNWRNSSQFPPNTVWVARPKDGK